MSGYENPMDGIVSSSENNFHVLMWWKHFKGTLWVLLKYVMASNLSYSTVSLVINYSQQPVSVEPSSSSLKMVYI